jgi:UDP-N-acetylglucosamine acyltransferase
MVSGARAEVVGINQVGLQRAGFTDAQVGRVKDAFRIVFRAKLSLTDALAQLKAEMGTHPEIANFVSFIEGSERGIMR